jgi:molybdate transport system substrate-binding protein
MVSATMLSGGTPRLRTASVTFLLAMVFTTFGAADVLADKVRVAAAANFAMAARDIGQAFEAATAHHTVFSFGSTGQLYAQIAQSAPFDIFLAADQARAQQAIDGGFAIPESRFTYAMGRLALFSRLPGLVMDEQTLRSISVDRVAVANPATAPYGAAAIQAMRALGVYAQLKSKIVQGVNIAQTYQFVATGNADVGFVALSQVKGGANGSRWVVPIDFHQPIAQDAVLLLRGVGNVAAHDFLSFLRGQEARRIKEKYGYGAEG